MNVVAGVGGKQRPELERGERRGWCVLACGETDVPEGEDGGKGRRTCET